jgi:hypothetical protein
MDRRQSQAANVTCLGSDRPTRFVAMIVFFAVAGFLLFLSGVVHAIQAYTIGRENMATVYGSCALFGLGLAITSALGKRSNSQPEPVKTEQVSSSFEIMQAAKLMARQMGEAAVRAVLLDPSSARFSSQLKGYAQGGFYVACGLVTGRNGFGGYAPIKRHLAIGTTASVEGVEHDANFENDFRSYCLLPDLNR